MRKPFLSVLCFLSLFFVACNTTDKEGEVHVPKFDDLESSFRNIPDSCKTAVYWYWLSDQISKDGVVKDLKAMKRVGINRAFIGNISLGEPDVPFPRYKIFSEEWWEILHTALKTATELGIEIGIFNSPGWSQSGGPWITEQQSMRHMFNETFSVEGPGRKVIDFRKVDGSQTVKVLAYPELPEVRKEWPISGIQREGLRMPFPGGHARTLILKLFSRAIAKAGIYAKSKDGFQLIKSFDIDRSNADLKVGFDPYAPIVISLPDMDTDEYRLEMEPANIGKALVTLSSRSYIERYPEKSLAKMSQTPLPLWNAYMWEKQPEEAVDEEFIKPKDVKDITFNMLDAYRLLWDVPDGKWKVVRYAMKTTGVKNAPASKEATGLEVDKMSKEHLSAHFNAFIGEIMRRIPEKDRKCFKIVVMDSYETGGLNWTDDMVDVFKYTYEYNPIPYLPVLFGEIVGNADISNRFLWDIRRLVANRVAFDYVKGLTEICHENGLTSWLENYGHWGFPAEFLQYGGHADEVSGEFWCEGELGSIENRAASSCAHIYGKNKVWAESFTSGGNSYGRYPYLFKKNGDRFYTEGINSNLLHVYIHQPCDSLSPGVNAWFGNEFNRKNTWFSHLDVFIDYLKRCNLLLQSGDYVADAAYYIGEDAPKMTGVTDPALPKGYSFDYINADVLRKHSSMSDGSLVLESGMKYKVLVLPPLKTMRPRVLVKLKNMVQEGLTLVGPPPSESPSLVRYPEADKEVVSLSNKLWNDKKNPYSTYEKGRVYPEGTEMETVFKDLGIYPDLKTDKEDPVLFIHRRLEDGDLYFLSNQSEQQICISPVFRIKGKQPELWNPLTAEIRYLTQFEEVDGGTEIPIVMEPLESMFVVFRSSKMKKTGLANFPAPEYNCEINGPWNLKFEGEEGILSRSMMIDTLKSWTCFENDTLRYYSGKAVYSTSFDIKEQPAGNSVYIDLGKVMVMAKIKINGKYAGGVWASPYRIPVSEFLKTGKNDLEIEVVNNWKNRLIGDLNLPRKSRKTWTSVCSWRIDSRLQEAGLMGPVRLLSFRYMQK